MVSSGSPLLLGLTETTFAGVDRSDWEKRMRICMRTVTMARQDAEKVRPFHEDKKEEP